MTMVTGWLAHQGNHQIRTSVDGLAAQEVALEFRPHVVITDCRMPRMDGIGLCQALRATDWGQKIYVLMLTAADQEIELVRAFDAGVDDYPHKTCSSYQSESKEFFCCYCRCKYIYPNKEMP